MLIVCWRKYNPQSNIIISSLSLFLLRSLYICNVYAQHREYVSRIYTAGNRGGCCCDYSEIKKSGPLSLSLSARHVRDESRAEEFLRLPPLRACDYYPSSLSLSLLERYRVYIMQSGSASGAGLRYVGRDKRAGLSRQLSKREKLIYASSGRWKR